MEIDWKKIPRTAGLDINLAAPPEGKLDEGAAEARQLSRGLSSRDLKKESEEADHGRSEAFKDHFEHMAIFAVWGVFAVFSLFGAACAYHLLTPLSWHWLSPNQMDAIQGLLTGGIMAGLIADHIRRRMG